MAGMEDLPTIVEIYNSTIASRMVTADTEPVSVESRKNWFLAHNSEKWPLWVVEIEGEPIGWLSFASFYDRPAYNQTAEISIYLHEKWRGKKLGPLILEYAEKQGKIRRFTTLLGFIFAHNIPSLKLFERNGYKEWAFLPEIALLDGERKGLKILGKPIG
jgi:phosphinothricin acetyltransferase